MSTFVFPPAEQATARVAGSTARFPVRRIYCIGRNYADHAIEMGHDPDREPPFFFQKNPDNVDTSGRFPYPPQSHDVHHEIELVAALHSGGKNIAVQDALGHVYGYAVGLDMTRRDLQAEMKKLGRPWEIAKAFAHAAPLSEIHTATNVGHPQAGQITLRVNGALRQQGDLKQMIWKVPEIIAHLSQYYELAAGDLIMTGTPAGVGPVAVGDVLVGAVEGVGTLTVTVV